MRQPSRPSAIIGKPTPNINLKAGWFLAQKKDKPAWTYKEHFLIYWGKYHAFNFKQTQSAILNLNYLKRNSLDHAKMSTKVEIKTLPWVLIRSSLYSLSPRREKRLAAFSFHLNKSRVGGDTLHNTTRRLTLYGGGPWGTVVTTLQFILWGAAKKECPKN